MGVDLNPVKFGIGQWGAGTLERETIATHSLSLDFMHVNIGVMHGRPVKSKKTLKNLFELDDVSILYESQRRWIFDSTDIDVAILSEIKKQSVDQNSVASSLEAGVDISKALLSPEFNHSNKIQSQSLKYMVDKDIPSNIIWDIGVDNIATVSDFIENEVPFVKTRDWLYQQLSELVAAETDRFISRISIKSRSVYAIH